MIDCHYLFHGKLNLFAILSISSGQITSYCYFPPEKSMYSSILSSKDLLYRPKKKVKFDCPLVSRPLGLCWRLSGAASTQLLLSQRVSPKPCLVITRLLKTKTFTTNLEIIRECKYVHINIIFFPCLQFNISFIYTFKYLVSSFLIRLQ